MTADDVVRAMSDVLAAELTLRARVRDLKRLIDGHDSGGLSDEIPTNGIPKRASETLGRLRGLELASQEPDHGVVSNPGLPRQVRLVPTTLGHVLRQPLGVEPDGGGSEC